MVELTENDFNIFKSEAEYWLNQFGLKDWRVDYAFEKLDEENRAECRYHWHGKTACLALNKWPSDSLSQGQIEESAFHEVCELLLIEMRRIALDEHIPFEEREGLTDCACHSVIRRLENSVFKNHIKGQ